jgi:hypothetical protein
MARGIVDAVMAMDGSTVTVYLLARVKLVAIYSCIVWKYRSSSRVE